MLIVGLTGGIGSGKTAVSEAFARRGTPVIDTDIIAREQVAPGQPALAQISARFGADCITADGELDRRRLRELVFSDPERRAELEAVLHPRIRCAVEQRLHTLKAPYCIVVIPLLVEKQNHGMRDMVQRILVVDVPASVQIARVISRDRVSDQQVRAILQAQASRQERLNAADDIIENSGDLAELEAKVEQLHEQYQTLGLSR